MITLHQMLHGYKLGHNYIQGSIVLPSTHDMDKIATLSDWSEYVGINHERDYITAYPLDESPFYVVAKTWYADEMRRPGCVWTHSLLIHKDDLTKITDFCNLLRLFEAPHAEDYVNYSTPRSFEENAKEIETELNEIGVNRAADAYELLLSSTSAFILSEFSSQQSQELLLSLLNFIPIGILNRMSICSGTASPRTYGGKYLSFQFVTHEGNSVLYLSNKSSAPWSQLVGVSVVNNRPQVARLIRHYQDEIGDSLEKLTGFLDVVVLINRTCKDEAEKQQVLLKIINTLSYAFPSQEDGGSFKSAVFQPSLARDFGGEENFLYVISTVNVDSFKKEQVEYEERIRNLPSAQFLGLLKRFYKAENLNEWGLRTVNDVAQYVSYCEIAGVMKTDPTFFRTIISSSSELFNQVVWSDCSKEDIQSILSVFSDQDMVDSFKHWVELFRTMLERNVPIASELARMAFSHDKTCVAEYLSYLNNPDHLPQSPVSIVLENYPGEVLDWLSKEKTINHDVAYVLANAVEEQSLLVKNNGSEIWESFYNLLGDSDAIQYYIFLYILSFNWNDQKALGYLRKAFYPIHNLLLQDKLDYNLWYRVEPYTEHLFFIQNWDKCKKMRKMVVRRLKDAGCSKSSVVNYTPDALVNEWLSKEW